MRLTQILMICGLIWFSGMALGEARITNSILPEDLENSATLICNATVLSIEKAGQAVDHTYPEINPSTHRETTMRARLEVLHVFKGEPRTEIEFLFRMSTPLPNSTTAADAIHVCLEVGKRYRFFLKSREKSSSYVGVLDEFYDDGFAVETLFPTERDDSPFLSREKAVEIARVYAGLKKWKLNAEAKGYVRCFPDSGNGALWLVIFFEPDKTHSRPINILVRGDGTVDSALTQAASER